MPYSVFSLKISDAVKRNKSYFIDNINALIEFTFKFELPKAIKTVLDEVNLITLASEANVSKTIDATIETDKTPTLLVKRKFDLSEPYVDTFLNIF